MLIALLICFLFAVICLCFDAIITNKGIKAGVAVEGNPLIVFFARTNKPALWQLFAIDGGLRAALLAFALFTPEPADFPHAWPALMIGGFIAFGLKNIMGYREWRWMFSHPGQLMPIPKTAWGQFIGFWG
jgi:hypothetical protein